MTLESWGVDGTTSEGNLVIAHCASGEWGSRIRFDGVSAPTARFAGPDQNE